MLVLVTIALYWPAMRCDFVNYDDQVYVTANVHVQNGLTLEGISWAFFKPEVYFGYWHPLTLLSHMLDCQLFGLNPRGHHLTSVLLHAINTILVFLLLRRLTGALWRSLMVAALFGLHPLHVESVVWVAERKDVLSACFGLLALLFYARYAQRRSQGADHGSPAASWKLEVGRSMLDVQSSSAINYSLSLFFFAIGLMSKPMLVTWPFVMLLLDYWPLRRFQPLPAASCPPSPIPSVKSVPSVAKNPGLSEADVRLQSVAKSFFCRLPALLFEKTPFFVLSVVASVATFVVQKHEGALAAGENLPLGARSANALVSYCRYLEKLFWPADLTVFYPHVGHWPVEPVLLAGALMVGISVFLFVKRRRYPFLLMGWLWYCGTLVPVIQLVQTGSHAMADRYTYIPSLGVLILATWGAHELARRWRHHVIALSLAGSLTIVLCLAVTRQQIGYWEGSETLFRHALEVTPNNHLAHFNLGSALLRKGQIDQAIRQFQAVIRLRPDDAWAHHNLGIALGRKGQIDEAIRQYQKAFRLKPDFADAHYNLGASL